MKLQFKQQDFQIEAVQAVVNCFERQPLKTNRFTLERSKELIKKAKLAALGTQTLGYDTDILEDIGYRNSPVQLSDNQMLQNINAVQQNNNLLLSAQIERPAGVNLGFNLTIEMETGTGKTYTYIRTMYELHKHYGWSKFIVIVPSIAIREGVFSAFNITRDHFQELYGHKINPFIYNSGRPQDIENFASDSRISVIIINTQAFAARGENARRIRMELDQFGTRRPIDIIAQTNPILIIDEPQSVGRQGSVTLKSLEEFKPILTLRYSATHAQGEEYNKIYRLDALDAYNKKLVKKIQVKGISIKGIAGTDAYCYLEQIVLSTNKPPTAKFEFNKRSGDSIKRVRMNLALGANLFELSGGIPAYQHMSITEIDGYNNKIVLGGIELFPGDILNNINEHDFRRIQIRETIISHLEKEKELFYSDVKVLSLFFIDSVEKYRTYDDDNNPQLGEYAKIFEEEYRNLVNNFIDLFHQDYNDYLLQNNASDVHKAYMPSAYEAFLKRDTADQIHNGYFSIDKKGRAVNPGLSRGSDDSDDISAYDLIMKDKERLLSFDEPTRFIFSHSALKEGWDNPNVFQICALKNPDVGSENRRRQEVGRGMRLCVNKLGIRLDFDLLGDRVHHINKLTVIASEKFESFAKGLQAEIAASLKDRPQKAEVNYFTAKLLTNELGQSYRIAEEDARKLQFKLIQSQVIDEDYNITALGRDLIEQQKVALPPSLTPFSDAVHKLLKSIYSVDLFKPEDERKAVSLHPNSNFAKKEFQDLWDKISFKSIYEVNFDTDKLITDSQSKINSDLYVSNRFFEVKTGELETGSKQDMESQNVIKETERTVTKIKNDLYTNVVYDLVGEIEARTHLKRQTIAAILKSISPAKFALMRVNPEEFIARAAHLINEVKSSLIINNIVYHKLENKHDAKTVFTNDKQWLNNNQLLKKHIYDYLLSDSQTESNFANALENATDVVVYAKLPKSFYIATPIENYSPDWAIVFDKEKVRHIYFVAETKGSDDDLQLREIEKLKIHCASKHFESVSNGSVKFSKISSYDKLLEIIQLK